MRLLIDRVLTLAACLSLLASGHAQDKVALVTVPFDSPALHMRAPFNVELPAGYEHDVARYPVLYLLHGIGDHYDAWVEKTNLLVYATRYPLIIVMPEADKGWYTNGVAPNARWEDYLMKEVIPYVESHYRTLQDQRMWAVAGLSMGGYGALKLGLKYRDQFSFAASMSGALYVTNWSDQDLKDRQDIAHTIDAAFGPVGSPARTANSLNTLLDAALGDKESGPPFIYLDCGTEDHLITDSRQFSETLLQKKVPHEYRERPGVHDWHEWDHQIQEVLKVLFEYWHLPVRDAGRTP